MRAMIVSVVLETFLASAFAQQHGAEDLVQSAENAYVYAYPLVLTHMTWLFYGGETNRLRHNRAFASQEQSRTAIYPNVDTLYSQAWLDLSEGPIIVQAPDTGGRYYVIHLLDGWDQTIATLGKRTTGTSAAIFAVAPPSWTGELPPNCKRVEVPTRFVRLLLRIQTDESADYSAAHSLQDRFAVRPLQGLGAAEFSASFGFLPGGRTGSPRMQTESLGGVMFFRLVTEAMKKTMPRSEDAQIVATLARLGISPGSPFTPEEIPAGIQNALNAGAHRGLERLRSVTITDRDLGGGWRGFKVGEFGSDYIRRAATARLAFASLPHEEATNVATRVDAAGEPLQGGRRYVMRFASGQLPPVNAFWSITMYDAAGHFVLNALDRYAVRNRDALTRDADGSIEISIQHDEPRGGKANWLPSPSSGTFLLVLRMYWPKESVLSGSWKAPSIRRIM